MRMYEKRASQSVRSTKPAFCTFFSVWTKTLRLLHAFPALKRLKEARSG